MTKEAASNVLNSLEELGKNQFMPSIGPIKGKIIAGIFKKYRPKDILEIGTLYGYSAILMASILPEEGRVTTTEIDKNNAHSARIDLEKLISFVLQKLFFGLGYLQFLTLHCCRHFFYYFPAKSNVHDHYLAMIPY
jgi:hypothetical protein